MKLCIVGIGGCGGKLAANLLENQDTPLMGKSLGSYICFGGVKGMWLEADVQETSTQTFFKALDTRLDTYQPFYFIPHDALPSESRTSRLLQMKYGYDLKKQGFFRQAEFLKAIFEIFDIDREIQETAIEETSFDNPILRGTWANIRPYTTLAGTNDGRNSHGLCDGILFVISLGGGTGTGFINPITSYIRSERSAYPVFVLGVLTENGKDFQQNTEESKRDLSAVISMHDLLVEPRGKGIDGLIIVDNQILKQRFGGNYPFMDKFIYQSMKPMLAERHFPGEDPGSLAVRELFLENLNTPPILVPCYTRGKNGNPVEGLVKDALTNGRLFGCEPRKAEKIYIFARGFIDSKELQYAAAAQTELDPEKIAVWRNVGNNRSNEVLILLRNPYGSAEAFKHEGTVEHRLHRILTMALEYISENRDELLQAGMTERTNLALEAYFYGKKGLRDILTLALSRIEHGEKPIFQDPLNIFEVLDAEEYAEVKAISERSLEEGQVRAIVEELLKEKGLLKENHCTAL
jgi:hypothetical protein